MSNSVQDLNFPILKYVSITFILDVGYAQGMNDIMSRFLVVMDTETEAYWMFVNYMEHFKNDFMEEGMLRKIGKESFFDIDTHILLIVCNM